MVSIRNQRSVFLIDIYSPIIRNRTAAIIAPRPRLLEKSLDEISIALVGSGVIVSGIGVCMAVINMVGDGFGVLVSMGE